MSSESTKSTLKDIVNAWTKELGITQGSLASVVGQQPEVLSRSIKSPPSNTANLVSNLATAISSITEHAYKSNAVKLSIPVLGRKDGKCVLINTTYDGRVVSPREVVGSFKGEVTVKSLLSAKRVDLQGENSAYDETLAIPQREWINGVSTPSSLLTTMYAVVPFHARLQEIEDLESWANSEGALRVRLYTGFGGVGKTRLATEICLRLRKQGFVSGFLDFDKTEALCDRLRPEYHTDESKVLLVLDYAETHRKEVCAVLKAAARVTTGRLRILLLSRAAGDWWEAVKRSDSVVTDLIAEQCSRPLELGALALTQKDRQASYCLARKSFAAKLKAELSTERAPKLSGKYYERVLLIHMMALIEIDDGLAGGVETPSYEMDGALVSDDSDEASARMMEGILDRILMREHKFWCDQLATRQLSPTLDRGFYLLMGVISSRCGLKTREEAVELIEKIQLFHGQSQATIASIVA